MKRIFSILLIEDDERVIYAVTEGLVDAGHVVTVATSCDEARAALTGDPQFDVVLLDLRLGCERGEDIFVGLRCSGVKYPPVVIVSAQPAHETRAAASLVEAKHVLHKPTSIHALCEAMENAVA